MSKSLCIALLMVMAVQLLAHKHHHEFNKPQEGPIEVARLEPHPQQHHTLNQHSVSILWHNHYFQGFWKAFTRNRNTTQYYKAVEELNAKLGASKENEINQRLIKVRETWNLDNFADLWKNWGPDHWKTRAGKTAVKSLRDLFRLTKEIFRVVYAPHKKFKIRESADLDDGALQICAQYQYGLPVFHRIFGTLAHYHHHYHKYLLQEEFNAGYFMGKLVLTMIQRGGDPFCRPTGRRPIRRAQQKPIIVTPQKAVKPIIRTRHYMRSPITRVDRDFHGKVIETIPVVTVNHPVHTIVHPIQHNVQPVQHNFQPAQNVVHTVHQPVQANAQGAPRGNAPGPIRRTAKMQAANTKRNTKVAAAHRK